MFECYPTSFCEGHVILLEFAKVFILSYYILPMPSCYSTRFCQGLNVVVLNVLLIDFAKDFMLFY